MSDECVCRKKTEQWWFIAAMAFAAVAGFANLGSDGIYAAQEGRTAIILRNMLRTGDFLEMQVPYGVPYEKPIGHYWLCLPSAYFSRLSGDALASAAEWGIRIPSALSALFTVWLAGLLAKRMFNWRAGCMTVVILSTMSNFDKLGRLGHIDMPLAAAFMAAMYFLYVGYAENWRANNRIYLFYAALGWGMLLKGPLVVMLAGMVVVGLMVMRGKRWYEVLRDLRLVRGAAIFLVISLPWYIYECIHSHGEFFEEFIVRQNLNRFSGDPTVYNKKTPVWYYIPKILAGALPWSIAAVAAAVVNWKRLLKLRLSDADKFLLIWFLTGFVFFSLSSIKRIDYLLPIFPPLAMLTAQAVDKFCRTAPAVPRKWWLTVWLVLAAILAAAFIVNTSGALIKLGKYIAAGNVKFLTEHDGMSMAMFSDYLRTRALWLLLAVAAAAGILFAAGMMVEKRRYGTFFMLVMVIVLSLFMGYHLGIEPGTDRLKTVKHFVRSARTIVPAGAEVALENNFNTELIFFMDHPYHTGVKPGDVWCLASPKATKRLEEKFPGVWHEHLRTPEDHQYPAVLLERRRPENGRSAK